MEDTKVESPPTPINGTSPPGTTCEPSRTDTSHDQILLQDTLNSPQNHPEVSSPPPSDKVVNSDTVSAIAGTSNPEISGVQDEKIQEEKLNDKERGPDVVQDDSTVVQDNGPNQEPLKTGGESEETDHISHPQDSEPLPLQEEPAMQKNQGGPGSETNRVTTETPVQQEHPIGETTKEPARLSNDGATNNPFQEQLPVSAAQDTSVHHAAEHIKDSTSHISTSVTGGANDGKCTNSANSIVIRTSQSAADSSLDEEVIDCEAKDVDHSVSKSKNDEDELECAEDALLSQLDAELDDASDSSDLHESELDLANGLTKEAVIEGLVDYQKIKRELEALKSRHKKKSVDFERMRGENETLRDLLADARRAISSRDGQLKEKENSIRTHQFKNKELQVVIEQHKEDLEKSREKLRGHDLAAKKAISQLQQEMVVRVNQVKSMYEDATREKENMVLKYAKSEKEVLDLRRTKETLEKKVKESQQLVESSNVQMKQLRVEMSKLKNSSISQESERANFQREIEQLKEEVNSQAIKVKWAQNKMKTELDSHKETKSKLAKTEQRLAEAKEETETIRKNCQDMIRQYQESEEVKSNSLGIKLKKTEEELQIRQQETTDQLELHNAKLKELNSLKQAHNDATAELESLRVKVQCLEDERIQQEEFLTQFKGLLNNQKEANRNLSKELEDAKAFEVQLTEANESIRQLEERLSNIQEDGKDLEMSLDASRQKESELLQFTEKITTKNTELHSEIGSLQSKVEALTEENKSLQSQLEDINSKHSQLSTDLQREKEFREREVTILTGRLNEKSRNEDDLSLKLEEAKDEAKTLKRRHAANTKDLTRQLQQAKKRIETLEKDTHGGKESNSMGSRTSSSGSLETAGLPGQSTSSSARGSISGPSPTAAGEDKQSVSSQSPQVTIASSNNDFPGIDKGMLVERIIRLQRLQQKYKEKIEFYQEHNKSMVEVIQKKNKIIQGYVLREETGALSTAASDRHKAQMSRQSGIMASLYRSQASDPKMTLDLSLEINQKLQAVLEDTLLKNMTLKENIDTLGREIARLSEDLFNAKEKLKARGK